MSKQKVEEIIPSLICQISNGEGVSVIEVARIYNISSSGLRKRLREVRDIFYKECFDYDSSTRRWVVKNGKKGFLQKELLDVKEAIVLTALVRTKHRLGKGLISTHEKIIRNYTKDLKYFVFKQHKSENITKCIKQIFAILKYAIESKNVVEFEYKNKQREVYPYRIVYIEYYWYLICAENFKIKSFRISLIIKPIILIDKYQYDFSSVDERLPFAMNAFIDYKEPFKYIYLLVVEKRVNHIEIASYFKSWKKLDKTIIINNVQYQKFEVKTTNPRYDDIIPTILKYMPEIIVDEPQELIDKINNILISYQNIYTIR